MFYPGALEIRTFIPNIYSNGYLAHDIIRFVIIIIMITLTLVDYIRKSKGDGKKFMKMISFSFILLIIIFVLFLALFIVKNVYCKKDEKDFFEIDTYTDGYKIAKMEEYAYYLESIMLVFVAIKVLMFFKLISLMSLMFSRRQTNGWPAWELIRCINPLSLRPIMPTV